MKRIHFISGLPRSGSTLLAGILRQNPRFHAGMSSPLAGIFMAALSAMSSRNEFAMFIEKPQREAVLRGLIENFYSTMPDSRIVFDTNRAWCGRLSALVQLLPDAKVICCVRNISWIIDSLERLVQGNALEISRMFHNPTGNQGGGAQGAGGGTVYARAEQLMDKGGMIKGPLDALREAFYGEHADRIMLVRYESLAGNPQSTLGEIYRFIGEDVFEHDFDNVEYSADEFDQWMGVPGLHRVQRKVELKERKMIIPPDIASKFDIEFWKDQKSNFRGVKIV